MSIGIGHKAGLCSVMYKDAVQMLEVVKYDTCRVGRGDKGMASWGTLMDASVPYMH